MFVQKKRIDVGKPNILKSSLSRNTYVIESDNHRNTKGERVVWQPYKQQKICRDK